MYSSSMALSAYRGIAKAKSLHLIEISDNVTAAIVKAEMKLRDPQIQARVMRSGSEIVEAVAFDVALEICRYLSARAAMSDSSDYVLPSWVPEVDMYIGRFIVEYGSLISIAEETLKLEWASYQQNAVFSTLAVKARSGYRKWLKVYVERFAGNSTPMPLALYGPIGHAIEQQMPSGKEFRKPSLAMRLRGNSGTWVEVPSDHAKSFILRAFNPQVGVAEAKIGAQEQKIIEDVFRGVDPVMGADFDENLDSMKVKTGATKEGQGI